MVTWQTNSGTLSFLSERENFGTWKLSSASHCASDCASECASACASASSTQSRKKASVDETAREVPETRRVSTMKENETLSPQFKVDIHSCLVILVNINGGSDFMKSI